MIGELARAIRERECILFAGAGVSMTVGLPSWRTLMEHMGAQLGFDPEVFADPEVSYFTLAEYYRLQEGSIGPLRSWMDRNWSIPEERLRTSKVHELIVRLDFPIVYTTNFDRNLEEAFHLHGKPFVKVANAKDVARVRDGVTQIIKFHGDFENDDSIVLDESSHYRRLDFESPLDIKLRADTLGRSVLFIGYSLADVNIRYLFYKLSQLWRSAEPSVPQPTSYVFSPSGNPVQEAVLAQWGIRMVALERKDATQALVEFLEGVVA